MEFYRALLNQEAEEDLDYYVVANDKLEAIEILRLALNRVPNFYDRILHVVQFRYKNMSLPATNITDEYPTGYFETIPKVLTANGEYPEFTEIIMPFHEFNVRQHYIDIALEDLGKHE